MHSYNENLLRVLAFAKKESKNNKEFLGIKIGHNNYKGYLKCNFSMNNTFNVAKNNKTNAMTLLYTICPYYWRI